MNERTFATWDEVPMGMLFKGNGALYLKLDSEVSAFTADVKSLGGWSGGWLQVPTSVLRSHRGPFTAIATAAV